MRHTRRPRHNPRLRQPALSRFSSEAEVRRQTNPADSVEKDPRQKSGTRHVPLAGWVICYIFREQAKGVTYTIIYCICSGLLMCRFLDAGNNETVRTLR